MPKTIIMKPGQMYRVHYTQELAKGKVSHWTFSALYLGKGGLAGDDYEFSLRPQAGTGSVKGKQIVSITPLSLKAAVVLPRRIQKLEVGP